MCFIEFVARGCVRVDGCQDLGDGDDDLVDRYLPQTHRALVEV